MSNLGIKTLSELVKGQSVFSSNGYAKIKRTIDGITEIVKIPIKSTGMAEFQEKLASKAPRPPVIEKLIKADSDVGRALGLQSDQVYMVFDTTDEKYIDEQKKHEEDFFFRVAIAAIDIEWRNEGGTQAGTYEERKAILQGAGITGHQLRRIFEAVQRLTQFTEAETDFLLQA